MALTDLLHYASQPVTLEPRETEQGKELKPSGLWVSVGSAWLDWCRDEEFRTDLTWYEHKVTVAAGASILILASALDLDDFSAEFGSPISPGFDSVHIDWGRVAGKYQWSRRLDLLWYYGWDCASGCIWNTEHVSLGEAVEIDPGPGESNG